LFGSLNPKRLIKDILLDSLEIGDQNKSIDKLERIKKNLLKVGLSSEILGKYPLNLSGGQRQKVLILKAILSEPQFIIFDEPMSSLDIKSQSEIILIIKKLMKSSNLTILFITHDFRLIKNLCDKVVVLSDGQIVETGQTGEVFNHPVHIETKKLLQVVK
jgi:ABC-type dipeptide/oligopeptide/nickel transport system ATPase subunit